MRSFFCSQVFLQKVDFTLASPFCTHYKRHMQFKAFLAVLFVFLSQPCGAVIRTQEIAPNINFPEIRQERGKHLAVRDDEVAPNGLLLVTIGGTTSAPVDMSVIQQAAARLGYAALAVDYPNSVISTVCRDRQEADCFDQFRAAIVTGQPVSNLVQVDEKNSILFRLKDVFSTMLKREPDVWSRYADAQGQLDWSHVVLMGHSQGSGHVVYMAKLFSVKAVVAVAGPQDYSTVHGPALWILKPGATPADHHYSLLHRDDYFGSDMQIALGRILLNDPQAPIARIQNTLTATETAHIIMSEMKVPDAHISLVQPAFADVWTTLLKRIAQP